ncbi:MAG TPA: M50 family metallopeptidase [Negativicutes bacterium]
MRVARLAGIQITLNNWFLILMAVFGLAGLGAKALAVFGAVLWHELWHALAARALGFTVREIELLPFGGVARIDRLGEAGAKNEILIAAAGPLSSLVLAAVVYLGMLQLPSWADELAFYCNMNLMLAGFNLIPALPLDGGRIFRAWLVFFFDYGKATLIAANVSKGTSLLLVGVTVYYYLDEGTVNLTVIIAAVFLYVSANAELKVASFRTMRILAYKKAELMARGVMPTRHFTARTSAVARDIIRLFGPEYYYVILVVDEGFHLCGTLTETEVWEALPLRGFYAQIREFL